MSGLLKVPFFHDEILPSFLYRSAVANGRPRLRSFCNDLGLDFEALMLGDIDATQHAERLMGYHAGFLCDRRAVVLKPGVVEFGGERFAAGAMKIKASRFCPRCLLDDDADEGRKPGVERYHRTTWMLEAVPVCARHGCRLVAHSGHERPGSVFETYRAMSSSKLSMMTQGVEPTEFERYVSTRVANIDVGRTDEGNYSLPECIELCLHLGMAATFGPTYGCRSLDCDETRTVRQAGFEVFRRSDSGFNELLDGLVAKAKSERAQRKYGLYGGIRDFLECRSNAYHLLRRQMHSHALQHNLENFPVRNHWTGIGDEMSVSMIAAASGTDVEGVLSYLRLHRLIPEGIASGLAVSVDRDVGEASVAALSQAISERAASDLLGCAITDLRSLVVSGIVAPLVWRGLPTDLQETDRYHRDHLSAFRHRLVQSTAGRDGLPTIEKAARQMGCEIGDVLKCVLDGRIDAFAEEGSRTPLIGLRVDVWKAVEALGLSGMVGARDARVRLGLDQASLKIAAGNGVVAAELDDLGNPVNLHLVDIRRFERRYVTVSSMARQLKVTERYVARAFFKHGIRPAFPALGLKTHVFHRGEVAKRFAGKRSESECDPCGIDLKRHGLHNLPPVGLLSRLADRRSMGKLSGGITDQRDFLLRGGERTLPRV